MNDSAQRFFKAALSYTKSQSENWVLSEEIEEQFYQDKKLNSFIESLLSEIDNLKEENTSKYIEVLQSEAKNYYTAQEVLNGLEETGVSSSSTKAAALYTKIILTLQHYLAGYNILLANTAKYYRKT